MQGDPDGNNDPRKAAEHAAQAPPSMDGQDANGEEGRITASLLVPIVQKAYDSNKELEELVGVSLRRPTPPMGRRTKVSTGLTSLELMP